MTASAAKNFKEKEYSVKSVSLDAVQILKAAGDPLRLSILAVLENASFAVQELASIFDMPQPGMSHHLKVLSTAGLVDARRQGNTLFYRRSLIDLDDPARDLCRQIFASADLRFDEKENLKVESRIAAIHEKRGLQSKDFFNKLDQNPDGGQASIAAHIEYQKSAERLIDQSLSVAKTSSMHAMEIGPGQGALLGYLAEKFSNVVALDNSEHMLENAKKGLSEINQSLCSKVEWICGEVDQAISNGLKSDLLAVSMVLHHMSSPAEMFKKFRKLINDRGVLYLAELKSHDQPWVKEACGDLWLGFDSDELDEWAEEASFKTLESQIVGLKNGFEVQLRTYLKH